MSDVSARRKVLFLEARNFGDAIIKNTMVSQYSTGRSDEQIDIWSKRQFADIFSGNKHIYKFYASGFPIAGLKSWNVIELIKTIWTLRKEHYDLAIDTVGDFRERFLLWLVRPKRTVSIERENGSPFNRLIRRGLSFLVEPVTIPKDMVNVYAQLAYLLGYLGVQKRTSETNDLSVHKKTRIIGIHPFASQECRLWDWKKWDELYKSLLKKGYVVNFFCSPKEREILEHHIKIRGNSKIVAGNMQEFLKALQRVDLLICLDSFAVHASYSLGVRSIMLNGANDFHIWQTPLTTVLTGAFDCKYWPCYNKPKCNDYQCVRSISVEYVMNNIYRCCDDCKNSIQVGARR